MTTFTRDLMSTIAAKARSLKESFDLREAGAISAEYVAILLVVAGVVAAVIGLNIDERVDSCGNQAVDTMFSDSAAAPAGGGADC